MLTKEGAKTLDTIGVQIILLVFIIGAGFAAWILWNNAAAPDALKNGVIGLASLLPLLASILPYLNVEKLESTFNFGLVYDSLNKEFSSGQSGNPYQTAYLDMFSNLSLSEAHAKIETASDPLVLLGLGLDIIEKGIVEVLIVPAPIHWESQWLQPYNLTVGDSVILSLDKVGERLSCCQ